MVILSQQAKDPTRQCRPEAIAEGSLRLEILREYPQNDNGAVSE